MNEFLLVEFPTPVWRNPKINIINKYKSCPYGLYPNDASQMIWSITNIQAERSLSSLQTIGPYLFHLLIYGKRCSLCLNLLILMFFSILCTDQSYFTIIKCSPVWFVGGELSLDYKKNKSFTHTNVPAHKSVGHRISLLLVDKVTQLFGPCRMHWE